MGNKYLQGNLSVTELDATNVVHSPKFSFTNGVSLTGTQNYQLDYYFMGYSPNPATYYPGKLVFNHDIKGSGGVSNPYLGTFTNTLKLVNANVNITLPSGNGTLALTNQFNFTTTSNTALLKVGPSDTHTIWNFGKAATLTLDKQTSSSSGYTSYSMDMTKVLLGTFDSSSGTLVLNTPTVSHVDEIL